MVRSSVLVMAGYLFSRLFGQPRPTPSETMEPQTQIVGFSPSGPSCDDDNDGGYIPSPKYRVAFGVQPGAVVKGWPRSGGFYVIPYSSVAELEFLGLDPFTTLERPNDPSDEEQHCAKMRQLGALWYEGEDMVLDLIHEDKRGDAAHLFVGWPATSGVWAIQTSHRQASKKGLGRIGNAAHMEERCQYIERLGGTFYANPEDCPHLDLNGTSSRSGRMILGRQ